MLWFMIAPEKVLWKSGSKEDTTLYHYITGDTSPEEHEEHNFL